MTDYVARGVRTKLYALLKKFDAECTLRYDVFAKYWRAMKFPLIFCDRADLPEFTEETLRIAKEFMLMKHNSLPMQVGGLYALYGLYMKQPIRPKMKIRVRIEEWKNMLNLMMQMRASKHADVVYIFTMLNKDQAFHYCAITRQEEYMFFDGWEWCKDESASICPTYPALAWGDVTESFNISMLQYHQAKRSLQAANGGKPLKLLSYVDHESGTKVLEDLIEQVIKLEMTEGDNDVYSSEEEDSTCDNDNDDHREWAKENWLFRACNRRTSKKQARGSNSGRRGIIQKSKRVTPEEDCSESSTSTDACSTKPEIPRLMLEFEDLMMDVLQKNDDCSDLKETDDNSVFNEDLPLSKYVTQPVTKGKVVKESEVSNVANDPMESSKVRTDQFHVRVTEDIPGGVQKLQDKQVKGRKSTKNKSKPGQSTKQLSHLKTHKEKGKTKAKITKRKKAVKNTTLVSTHPKDLQPAQHTNDSSTTTAQQNMDVMKMKDDNEHGTANRALDKKIKLEDTPQNLQSRCDYENPRQAVQESTVRMPSDVTRTSCLKRKATTDSSQRAFKGKRSVRFAEKLVEEQQQVESDEKPIYKIEITVKDD